MEKIVYLIVDAQNDFCHPSGSLFVPGAEKDVKNISSFICSFGHKIEKIYATMDWHRTNSIFFPSFWSGVNGEPKPYELILHFGVKWHVFTPKNPKYYDVAFDYTKRLEEYSGDHLCIWPPHCLQGSWGANMAEEIERTFFEWEIKTGKNIEYVLKGTNIFTESYSAIMPEVVDNKEEIVKDNTFLVPRLNEYDLILISGEAGSHCVMRTIQDIVALTKSSNIIKKMFWLEDTISPVKGFEEKQQKFVEEMKAKGMKVMKTTDLM